MILFFSFLTGISHVYIEPISRREANFAFICWITTFVLILILIEIIMQILTTVLKHVEIFSSRITCNSIVYSSISYSGFLLFLIANILTGFVNFVFDTLSVSSLQTILILFTYSFILSYIAVILNLKQVQLKIPVRKQKEL